MPGLSKNAETQFGEYQSRLLPYAYNILGDSMEAEDVVQEVLNKYFIEPSDHIDKPVNYLIRSVINRSINAKKQLQMISPDYNGQWLPSPVNTEEGIYQYTDRNKILNYSLLVLLERLNPKERAVFILNESFEFAHGEIAEMLGITVENSRQLYRRARQKLEPDLNQSFQLSPDPTGVLQHLTDAILEADVERVRTLLSEDIQSYSDGGVKVRAARNVIHGRENVFKFLKAFYGKYSLPGTETSFSIVNHKPAILYKLNDKTYRCLIVEMKEEKIESLYVIVNPDKLRHI